MTSLLIAYPDIGLNAKTITPGATVDTDQNERNLVSGERYRYFKFSSTATSATIKFDLGSGNSSSIQYAYLARADKLVSAGLNRFELARSSDDISYTNEIDSSPVSIYGPRLDDWLTVIPSTSAYRYWRATYTSSGAQNFFHSKLYFGSFFDWAKEPSGVGIERVAAGNEPFITSSGSQIGERINEPKYKFTFTWSGVSDSKIKSFQNLIGKIKHRENGVFLYAATETHVLDGQTLVHCKVDSVESRKTWYGWNEIRATFTEMLG